MSYVSLRKGISDALSKAGTTLSKAAVTAQAYGEAQIQALSGSKLLKDYKLLHQVATCGPGDVWKVYAGVSKRAGNADVGQINASGETELCAVSLQH
jgi:hypothetical protein